MSAPLTNADAALSRSGASANPDRTAHEHTIVWHGITVAIRHVPSWLGLDIDHLEIRSLMPERVPLPITATGYRSHFLHPRELAGHGGVEGFVLAWLDDAARSTAWKEAAASPKQLSLF